MPVSYQEAVKTACDENFVGRAIKSIDERLANPQWIKDWRCGQDDNPYWKIVLEGVASETEKRKLKEAYENAGWGEVHVKNSDEGEYRERPGCVGVTLYRDRQSS